MNFSNFSHNCNIILRLLLEVVNIGPTTLDSISQFVDKLVARTSRAWYIDVYLIHLYFGYPLSVIKKSLFGIIVINSILPIVELSLRILKHLFEYIYPRW